ncbi:MAG: hypothetical protein ACOCSJ_02995 [Candidatus Natronoplasma sp.]
MSEEGKVRLMVIPIVAMLAVTMIVAGWQYEEQVEIDVDEGYDEMQINYVEPGKAIPPTEDGREMENATAATEIEDGEAILEFDVETEEISCGGHPTRTDVRLGLLVEGDFNESLSPDSIRFSVELVNETTESLITFDFYKGYIEADGATLWPIEDIRSGGKGSEPAYLGFDINEDEFTIRNEISWDIYDEDLGTYTLELSAEIEGLSEEITSTVQVTISDGG